MVTTTIHPVGTNTFWDFVKYTIIIQAGLSHCSPEHEECGDKLLPVPISAVCLRMPESPELPAPSHLLSDQLGCAHCMDGECAAACSCSSSSCSPCAGHHQGWGQGKLPNTFTHHLQTQEGRRGHKDIWLEMQGLFCLQFACQSISSEVAKPRLRDVPGVPQDCSRLWAPTPGSCTAARKTAKDRKTITITKLVHTYQTSL